MRYRPLNLPSVDETSLTWILFSLQSTCLLTDWKLLKLNCLDCWIMHHCVGLTLQCPVRQQRASREVKRQSLPRGQWFYTSWKQHKWGRKLVLPILFIKKTLGVYVNTHRGEVLRAFWTLPATLSHLLSLLFRRGGEYEFWYGDVHSFSLLACTGILLESLSNLWIPLLKWGEVLATRCAKALLSALGLRLY